MRGDGRAWDEMRALTLEASPLRYPEGSALVRLGDTHVLVSVTVTPGVPDWRKGRGGWLTAEYALLPRSTHTRTPRDHILGGRAQEIRRLLGRSLRQAVDLTALGESTITVDCDVLQADGGTRTAAINGGYVALALALRGLETQSDGTIRALRPPVAAISVGIVAGELCLDLDYAEDARAQMDLNVVMDAEGRFIEVQGTAEGDPVPRGELDALMDLAAKGIETVIRVQRETLACAGCKA